MMALAPFVSASFSARRRNMNRDGEISPRTGTTTTSPLWITSRAGRFPRIAKLAMKTMIDNLFISWKPVRRWLNLASLQRANERKIKPVIPSETIEQIAAANDIVEVIGTYFPLKRAGANFKALCPFHQEKTPSFTVSPQRQTFHCFGCGVGGSVFRFVMDYEHIDFPSAVRKLAARGGIPVIEERGPIGAEDRHI